MKALRQALGTAVLAILSIAASTAAQAAPYVPANDDEVVEKLPYRPGDPVERETRQLRQALAGGTQNLQLAAQVARRYIELGRATGDPRFDGYAQAALSPWWKQPDPPRDALILRATLKQHIHEFKPALEDLGLALRNDPGDVQARLTRATVEQVQGDFDAARRDCAKLGTQVDLIIVLTCVSSVDAMQGRLKQSRTALQEALQRTPGAPPEIREWVLTLIAEMAEREGAVADAQRFYAAARQIDHDDPYLIGAYADFLLSQHDAAGAAALTAGHGLNDVLLLRQAEAAQAIGSGATPLIEDLRGRFAASRMRGDRIHQREEARFTLHLLHDPAAALVLAREDWSIQKEPADILVYAEAARAAGDRASLDELRSWRAHTGFEDVRLDRLLQE